MRCRRLVCLVASVCVSTAPLVVSAAPSARNPPQGGTTSQPVVVRSQLSVSGVVLKSDHKTHVPDVRLRLRNVTTGAIVGRTISDADGRYSFTAPEPGLYVVEAVDDDERGVRAVTDPFQLPHEAFITNVILPGRSGLAALFTNTAFLLLAGGAAAGIIAIQPPTAVQSPER